MTRQGEPSSVSRRKVFANCSRVGSPRTVRPTQKPPSSQRQVTIRIAGDRRLHGLSRARRACAISHRRAAATPRQLLFVQDASAGAYVFPSTSEDERDFGLLDRSRRRRGKKHITYAPIIFESKVTYLPGPPPNSGTPQPRALSRRELAAGTACCASAKPRPIP